MAISVGILLLTSPQTLAQDPAGSGSADDEAPESAMVETPATASEGDDEPAPIQITGEFRRELRTVEGEVNHLKERVFRSKATLQLLKELVIEGVLAIRAQVKPSVVERLLRSFVTPAERPDEQLSRRFLRSHRDAVREPEEPRIDVDKPAEPLRPLPARSNPEAAQSLSL